MWVAFCNGVVVTLVTLPFCFHILELRRHGSRTRLNAVRGFSADVFSYWTSPAPSAVGPLIRAYPKAEGELFPTIAALLLGAVGVAGSVSLAWERARAQPAAMSVALRPLVWVIVAAAVVYSLFVLLILTGNGFTRIGPFAIAVRNLWRNARVLVVILGLLLVVSPRARSFARQWIGTIAAFVLLAALAAFLMSLGPEIRSGGRLISEVGPYHFFYWFVPGFDGLRVPARFAMLVVLFLSVAAGLGASAIERRFRRGGVIAVALGAVAVAEAFSRPRLNGTTAEVRYAMPPARVFGGRGARGVSLLKSLPRPAQSSSSSARRIGYERPTCFTRPRPASVVERL